jgi:hypothetical protein
VPPPDLDAWLPHATVRTHHTHAASAAPDALWRAAQQIRLADTRTLGRMVRWRIPGTPAARTYHELFSAYPFTVLDEGDAHLVSGLCGRIWTVERDYPRLDGPDEFASWSLRGTVRVLFAPWVAPAGAGRAELVSEARVEPVDRQAAIRLKTLWALIGSFERLVGAEPLKLAARRAERG